MCKVSKNYLIAQIFMELSVLKGYMNRTAKATLSRLLFCESEYISYLCIDKRFNAMLIKNATFSISSPTVAQCPNDVKPEFAFIGRSNVGKSSLINMLCNHKGLAKTSSVPGKTLLINHFIINNEWYLVDLPGYGYAKRSKTVQDKLEQMIRSYILLRRQLVNVFVLIDVRHEQQRIDREFVDWLGESRIPFSIVFTKADKLGPVKARMNAKAWMDQLLDTWETLPPYFITSAAKRSGRDEVLDYIDSILKEVK